MTTAARDATNSESEDAKMKQIMYKCRECGCVFAEGNQAVWQEALGEYWGAPVMETMTGCPECHGEYDECEKCAICGEYKFTDELFGFSQDTCVGGVCDDCIDDYRFDFGKCYDIAGEEKTEVSINALLASLFSPKDIEDILLRNLLDSRPIIDCSPFIDSDKEWFAEELMEKERG